MRKILGGAFLSLALISPALAHPGHTLFQMGFLAGFFHPFSGLDHILTMLAVGYWAARQPSWWQLPLAFMIALLAGALAVNLVALAQVENFVMAATTLLVIAAYRNLRFRVGLVLVLFAGFFHGFAHGQEIPADFAMSAFSLGFLSATALLHGTGIIGTQLYRRYIQRSWISNQV